MVTEKGYARALYRTDVAWWQRRSVISAIQTTVVYVVLVSVGFFVLIPVYWMLISSVKPEHEIFLFPPTWIPGEIRLYNYPKALELFPFMVYLTNTVIITAGVVAGRLFSSTLAGFAFARLRFRLREPLFMLVLSTMMIPYAVMLIPQYLIFRGLGWLDSPLPLIVPTWLGTGAFYIFLLRQFFLTIPHEMDDAAHIDGCSAFGVFWRIILPLSKPALGTVAIFSFLSEWNDFLGPLIYLNSAAKQTLSVGVAYWLVTSSAAMAFDRILWSHFMVVSLLIALPPVVVFFFAQRYFIQGVVVTGVKG